MITINNNEDLSQFDKYKLYPKVILLFLVLQWGHF